MFSKLKVLGHFTLFSKTGLISCSRSISSSTLKKPLVVVTNSFATPPQGPHGPQFIQKDESNSPNQISSTKNGTTDEKFPPDSDPHVQLVTQDRINDLLLRTEALLGPQLSSSKSLRFTLQTLFDSHAALIQSYISKLGGSNHPILEIASDFYSENSQPSPSSLRVRSMVVLLFGEALRDDEGSSAVQEAQRTLAEITELIYTAQTFHRTVVNIDKGLTQELSTSYYHGNKLATLMGDFLLAKTCKGLASLNNGRVMELMSNAIADYSESNFIGSQLTENKSLAVFQSWKERTDKSIGSLLGHACACTMIVAKKDEALQSLAYRFGEKVALVLQIHKDLSTFDKSNPGDFQPSFENWPLPLIYYMEENPEVINSHSSIDYKHVYDEIRASQKHLDRARETMRLYQRDAKRLVSQLGDSPFTRLLTEFLHLL